MAKMCNVCGTGIQPCNDDGHEFDVFEAIVPYDHYMMMVLLHLIFFVIRVYFHNFYQCTTA